MLQVVDKDRRLRFFGERAKMGCDSPRSWFFGEQVPNFSFDLKRQHRCVLGVKYKLRIGRKSKAAHRRDPFDRLKQIASDVVAENQPSADILEWIEQFGIEQEFGRLADEWERETRNISSPKKIAEHSAVQKIIEMGKPAIPFILRRMKHHPWFWFHALMQLAKPRHNPVTPAMHGDMQRMTSAWIAWGVRHGYV